MTFRAQLNSFFPIQNPKKLHIMGHSMGGILSIFYLGLDENSVSNIASCTAIASAVSYHDSGTAFERFLKYEKIALRFPFLMELFIPHGIFSKTISEFVGYFNNPLESFELVSSNVHPHIIRLLYKYGFHSIPLKLMIQLGSGLRFEEGLRSNETEKPFYLHSLRKCSKNEAGKKKLKNKFLQYYW